MPILAYLLLVLFVGLKLAGIIAWSWLWVLAPIWLGFALWFGVAFVGLIVLAVFRRNMIVKPGFGQKLRSRRR